MWSIGGWVSPEGMKDCIPHLDRPDENSLCYMLHTTTVTRISAHLQFFDKVLLRELWVPCLKLQVHGGGEERALAVLTDGPVAKVVIHTHRHFHHLLIAEHKEPEEGGICGDKGKQ